MSSDTEEAAAAATVRAARAAAAATRAVAAAAWREVPLAAWRGEAAEDAAAVRAVLASEAHDRAWNAWMEAKRAYRERKAVT